jgi:hypothetical protein
MTEVLKDPFFVQKVSGGEEISIDLSSASPEKILLECICCRKEFDPEDSEHKSIPSSNYCKDCFSFEV